MKIIPPITMTDAQLTASNLPETDYSAWDSGTGYNDGDYVISTTTHKIYVSVAGSNTNHDPTTDDGTWWVEYSATNLWKPFDGVIADQATKASGAITYSITPATTVDAIVFLNMAASVVRVQVYDTNPTEVYDSSQELVDASDIIDWWAFFTTDLDRFQNTAVFTNLGALPGYQIDITIGTAGDTNVSIGEIVLGRLVYIGETLDGSEIGLDSFSTKEQDAFGNWNIVSRAKSDPFDATVAVQAKDVPRVKRVLAARRDLPTIYMAHEDLVADYDAISYGLFQSFRIPLYNRGVSFLRLEIEGLT